MKIRRKIMLVFSLMLFLCTSLVAIVSYHSAKKALIEARYEELQIIALSEKESIRQLIRAWVDRAKLIASRTQLRTSFSDYLTTGTMRHLTVMRSILNDALLSVPLVESITLCDQQGNQVVTAPDRLLKKTPCQLHDRYALEFDDRLSVLPPLTGGQSPLLDGYTLKGVSLGNVDESGRSASLYLLMAGPVVRDGTVLGTIQLVINGQGLLEIVNNHESLQRSGEAVIARMNEQGDIQYLTPLRYNSLEWLEARRSLIDQVLLGMPIMDKLYYDYREKPVYAVSESLGEFLWGIVVKIDHEDAIGSVVHFSRDLILYTLLLLLLGLLVCHRLSLWLTRPVRALTHVAETIRDGHMGREADETVAGELGTLAKTFNQMVKALQEVKAKHQHAVHERSEFGLILSSVREGIFRIDNDAVIVYANPTTLELLEYAESEFVNQPVFALVQEHSDSPYKLPFVETVIYQALSEQIAVYADNIYFLKKSGKRINVAIRATPIFNDEQAMSGVVVVFRDITAEREYTEKLDFLAHHDGLTQLPNRICCLEYLEESLERSNNSDHQVAVLFIDVDRFKTINDYHGHLVGDQVLKVVADRLRRCLPKHEFVARLGGDEFVAIVQGGGELYYELDRQVRHLLRALSEPVVLDQLEMTITSSVGIALFPIHASNALELLRNADLAMYEAKLRGRNQLCWFNEMIANKLQREKYLQEGLQAALDNGDLEVLYQPICNAKGDVGGFESLCRWNFNGEPIAAEEFITVAEKSQLIDRLGRFVFDQALDFLKDLRVHKGFSGYVALNVSLYQLRDQKFVKYIKRKISKTGIPIGKLLLEITESKLVENFDDYQQTFDYMIKNGFYMALDDFGTGYASFRHLRYMPVQYLKIDQLFIRDIPDNQSAAKTVALMLMLGESLDLQTVVEGVETQEQAEWLGRYRCSQQGYFHSHPISRERSLGLLRLAG